MHRLMSLDFRIVAGASKSIRIYTKSKRIYGIRCRVVAPYRPYRWHPPYTSQSLKRKRKRPTTRKVHPLKMFRPKMWAKFISLTINWFTMPQYRLVLFIFVIIWDAPPDWVSVYLSASSFLQFRSEEISIILVYSNAPKANIMCINWYMKWFQTWRTVHFCHRQHATSLCRLFQNQKTMKATIRNVAARRRVLYHAMEAHKKDHRRRYRRRQ